MIFFPTTMTVYRFLSPFDIFFYPLKKGIHLFSLEVYERKEADRSGLKVHKLYVCARNEHFVSSEWNTPSRWSVWKNTLSEGIHFLPYTSRDTLLSYTSFSALKYSQLPFFHCNGLKVRKLYVCARKEERKDERKEVGCSGLKVHKLYCGKKLL